MGDRGEKFLRKCREILVNAYLAPGFLPSRLRRSLMKQFDEEESWTQRVLVHIAAQFCKDVFVCASNLGDITNLPSFAK